MKNSKKIIENFEYNKRNRSYNVALSSEKHRIYNHPTLEDKKLYYSIKFFYNKTKDKKKKKATDHMEERVKLTNSNAYTSNKFEDLTDECEHMHFANEEEEYESAYESDLEVFRACKEENSNYNKRRAKEGKKALNNIANTTVDEKLEKIEKSLKIKNKADWRLIFSLNLDEIIAIKNMVDDETNKTLPGWRDQQTGGKRKNTVRPQWKHK